MCRRKLGPKISSSGQAPGLIQIWQQRMMGNGSHRQEDPQKLKVLRMMRENLSEEGMEKDIR